MDAFSEAQRWLSVAERLLAMRDLQSAHTFAIRAREADPRLDFADRILAVADTLIAGESNSFVDYYAVLQIARWTQNVELIATQYRKLALLLNPNVNQLPFADQAFRLVCEAWAVLSNAARKAMYDGQLGLNLAPPVAPATGLSFQQQWVQQPPPPPPPQHSQPQVQWDLGGSSFVQQPQPDPQQQRVVAETNWLSFAQREQQQRQELQQQRQVNLQETQQQPQREVRQEPLQQQQQQGKQVGQGEHGQQAARENPRVVEENEAVAEEERPGGDDDVTDSDGTGFWTACPYCFYLYEYPKKYEECILRCQHCDRAFEAVVIPGPPLKGKDKYFCCWGFYPLGCSGKVKNSGRFSGWSPISPMFGCPGQGGGKNKKAPRFVFNDDDVFLEVSDPSDDSDDDDWTTTKRRKKSKSAKGRAHSGKNVRSAQSERSKKGVQSNGNTGENMNGTPVTRASNLSEGESSKNVVVTSGKKQTGRVTRGMGRLDLNVEFSNEVEEPTATANGGNRAESGEDDNIEGTGFFEGLDEFLSTLPILNVVGGEDKIKTA